MTELQMALLVGIAFLFVGFVAGMNVQVFLDRPRTGREHDTKALLRQADLHAASGADDFEVASYRYAAGAPDDDQIRKEMLGKVGRA